MRAIGSYINTKLKRQLGWFNPLLSSLKHILKGWLLVRRQVNPMPTVTYEGKTYKLRSRKTEVPDLEAMDSLSAHIWLNRNTTAKGYRKEPALVLPNTITILAK
jgi:hypothetical protein